MVVDRFDGVGCSHADGREARPGEDGAVAPGSAVGGTVLGGAPRPVDVPVVRLSEDLLNLRIGESPPEGEPRSVSDHVQVHEDLGLLEREEGVLGVVGTAQKAALLPAEEEEKERPLAGEGRSSEGLGGAEDVHAPRGVVQGAGEEGSNGSQMVQMTAEDEDFLLQLRIASLQESDNVAPFPLGMACRGGGDPRLEGGGEGPRLEGLDDLLLEHLDVFPCREKELAGQFVCGVGVDEARLVEGVGVSYLVQDEQADGPMAEGVFQLVAGPVVGGPGGAWGIVLFVGASGFHKDDLPLRRDATVIVVFQLRSGYAEADVDNLSFDLSRGRVGAGEVLIGEEERPLFEGSGAVLYEKDDGTGGVHGGVGGRELRERGPPCAAGADTPLLQPIRTPLGGQAVLGGSGKPSSELGGGELLGVSQKGVAGNVVKPF